MRCTAALRGFVMQPHPAMNCRTCNAIRAGGGRGLLHALVGVDDNAFVTKSLRASRNISIHNRRPERIPVDLGNELERLTLGTAVRRQPVEVGRPAGSVDADAPPYRV